jgi:hypothetical protein
MILERRKANLQKAGIIAIRIDAKIKGKVAVPFVQDTPPSPVCEQRPANGQPSGIHIKRGRKNGGQGLLHCHSTGRKAGCLYIADNPIAEGS